jgi:hypothetical protein
MHLVSCDEKFTESSVGAKLRQTRHRRSSPLTKRAITFYYRQITNPKKNHCLSMRMKSKGLLCIISTTWAIWRTIKNVGWKIPGSHEFPEKQLSDDNETSSSLPNPDEEPKIFPDTTIIITSNFIPSHPSTEIIVKTIASLELLRGLRGTSTMIPLIVTVDGPYAKDRGPDSKRGRILKKYIDNLQQTYDSHDMYNVTILPQTINVKLIKNVQHAISFVTTKFLYILQHDLPFVKHVDHTSLVKTVSQYPQKIRLVRFGLHKTLSRNRDVPPNGTCVDLFHSSHGIHLTKTHTWSDNNHFTTKAYYEEMLSSVPGFQQGNFMEMPMKNMALQDCAKWGTWLYGERDHGPTIQHLDGKHWKRKEST